MSISILIADDHGVLLAGLRALLSAEPDMQVVGQLPTATKRCAWPTNFNQTWCLPTSTCRARPASR